MQNKEKECVRINGKMDGLGEHAVFRYHLKTEQLEYSADKDINSGAEDIRSQKFISVRAVGFCKRAENTDRLLQHELQFSRDIFKPWYGKYSDQSRYKQQGACYHKI